MKKTEYTTFSFDEHAKKCDVDDFLKQMLRMYMGGTKYSKKLDLRKRKELLKCKIEV